MTSVLVVDDEPAVRSFLREALAAEGYDVHEAADGQAALGRIEQRGFQVVVTDLRMPGLDGMELLGRLRAEHPDTEVIVLTAYGSVESAVQAMKLGAFDYLQKPLASPAELRLLVGRAVERHRLRASREAALRGELPPLAYGAPAMEPVVHALRKVAPTDATVLLLGESGTGKEVAARAVHRWSARAGGPFVAVNCAALSAELLESELFGHERGAFTGATARRRGRLELCDGGTFFLDEVAELRPALQAKLLRVLQERHFERVGGNQTIGCDVRWIAATNRDLGEMLRQGSLREDLYHRLAVFPLRMPPLRERREDIPDLARAILSGVAAQLGRPRLSLSEAACRALAAADWPGNVRQLANALERAAILADADELDATDLALGAPAPPDPGAAVPTMEEAEREAIRRALEHYQGNRRQAASHLGIGLRTLYERLRRYGFGAQRGLRPQPNSDPLSRERERERAEENPRAARRFSEVVAQNRSLGG
ncbi:MAG: sigma-54-dependent Fis family transcriptional regulator [Deltaproteobacteria bacterium]|nr:sigma-54-dependent Fis family transcriptional regulator [Deltaproteobacteria bacterium]